MARPKSNNKKVRVNTTIPREVRKIAEDNEMNMSELLESEIIKEYEKQRNVTLKGEFGDEYGNVKFEIEGSSKIPYWNDDLKLRVIISLLDSCSQDNLEGSEHMIELFNRLIEEVIDTANFIKNPMYDRNEKN